MFQQSSIELVRKRLNLPTPLIKEFCRKHHIRKLSLFGSIVREDFGPNSDVDILVEFDPKDVPSLFTFSGIALNFSDLLGGTKVDMLTPKGLSKYI
tara:strand:+ start:311 stop:598 length:288 start_codon:yes stop_codon:yes gene_type:complete